MSEFPHRSDSSAVTVSCIYADPLRTVSGGILSVLTWTVPRVPTVPQQNVTIVTRELLASAERQTLFFFPLRLNGLEAESHDEPSTPFPCEQLGARRGEARRGGLHADVFVTERCSEPPDGPGDSEASDLWRSLPESLQRLWENDWTDGLVTHSQMTGWQWGRGLHVQIPGDGWYGGMQRICVMN